MKKILSTLTASAALALIAQAHAQIVNFEVDINRPVYTGVGVLGSGNEYWNLVSPGTGVTSSTESDGSTSSTDGLSFSSAGVYSGGGNNASSNVLLNGYAFSSSLEPITFSGLENGEYNLVLFGTNAAYSNGASTDFTVSNTLLDPADPTQSATKTTTEDSTSSSFSDPANYIEFTDVVVTNHTISASYKVATAEADFNGAQLEYVGPAPTPEPSSFALVAISIGGLVFLARRHLKA